MQIPDHLLARSVNLVFNVGLAVPWLHIPRSLFGDFTSKSDLPRDLETEFAAFRKFDRETLGSASRAFLPLPLLGRSLRQRSGPIQVRSQFAGSHPTQAWFFINGICSDERLATLNVRMLSQLFERPITLLHNATDGLWFDLIECAVGKSFDKVTEAAAASLPPLVDALCDPGIERVILLSHSQGTIIAAVMLKWLDEVLAKRPAQADQGAGVQKVSPERKVARKLAGKAGKREQPAPARQAMERASACLSSNDIGKLELYCFANCATSMGPIAVGGTPVHHTPWIESYGNEHDLVARFGLLSPPHGIGSARIEGERYRRDGAWGHLLNAHYLIPMIEDMKSGGGAGRLAVIGENLRATPRLWEYHAGRTPAPYP